MKHTHGPSEVEIVAGCRRGERAAFRALFEKHHRGIFRLLVARCGDPDLAEDLVQETFLVAFESISDFRGEARVETWMARIALNRLYAVSRRDQLGRRTLEELTAGDPRGRWVSARERIRDDGPALRDLVHRAILRLDPDDATVILLHDLQGFRYREIAEILDVAIGTVASRLSRARERLRTIVEELAGPREESGSLERHTPSRRDGHDDESSRGATRTSDRIVWSGR